MMQEDKITRHKGGRPKKPIRKNQVISLKCSSLDKARIGAKARKARMSVSEYLLEISRSGIIVCNEKELPREVLALMGTLNHMAANLNQVARKRNSVTDELNAVEREALNILSGEVKDIVKQIKSHLQ